MSGTRVNVDRALYLSALRDAMEWQESILVTHNPGWDHGPAPAHCTPGNRCDQYKVEAAQLARYRKAYARAGGATRREPEGHAVTLTELMERQ